MAFGPYLAQGAVAAMSDPAFVLPAGKTKEDVLAVILEGLFKGLVADGAYGLSIDDQKHLLSSYAAAAGSSVDEAGFADRGAALTLVARTAIASLDDGGVAATRVGEVGEAVLQTLLASVSGAGLSAAADVDAAVVSITRAAVASLPAAGIATDVAIDASARRFVMTIASSLSAAGLATADQVETSERIAEAAAQGLADLGADAERIAATSEGLSTSIAEGLARSGVGADQQAETKRKAEEAIAAYSETLGL